MTNSPDQILDISISNPNGYTSYFTLLPLYQIFQKIIPLILCFLVFLFISFKIPSRFVFQEHASESTLLNGPNGSFLNTKIDQLSRFNFPLLLDFIFVHQKIKPIMMGPISILLFQNEELLKTYNGSDPPSLQFDEDSFTGCGLIIMLPICNSIEYKSHLIQPKEQNMEVSIRWKISNIQFSFIVLLLRASFGLMILMLLLFRLNHKVIDGLSTKPLFFSFFVFDE